MCRLKKLASILLLGILLFNWFGYQILTSYLERRAIQQLDNLVDRNFFEESQLISIKVPAERLGYFVNSLQFERVTGKIEIGGIQYNLVKRRLFNDSLEFVCIPNIKSTALKSARNEICKWVNDLSGQNKKTESHPGPSKNLTTDFYTTTGAVNLASLRILLCHQMREEIMSLSRPHLIKVEQPPEIKA
ncbi:MAG: hypothetical protein C5B59_08340 [Bacteroidetes bacterium]|nr:MAG: hypothetical protein C5B59_08340 [Bacteroidota bacterium]